MTENKKGADLSNRLKRPLKTSSRTAKTSSSSTISAPPKAAIASSKTTKDEVHRRKNPFNEMLRPRASKDATRNSKTPVGKTEAGIEQGMHTSKDAVGSTQDAKVADRVAEMEIALSVAREEHNVLREELEKAKQHSQVCRETIEDYRRQLNTTYGSQPRPATPASNNAHMDYRFDRSPHPSTMEPRPSLTEQQDDLVEENHRLRSRLSELHEKLISQDSPHRTRSESEWESLTARLHHTEKESQERLRQLLDLKHSISSLTRTEKQITDSDLTEQVDQLYHRIREWVISNFRRTKLDFSGLTLDTIKVLEAIYPQYNTIGPTDRLAFYQSIISNALMHMFREPLCLGLPESSALSPIRQLAAYIQQTGSEYREWRRTTIRALEKSEARAALQQEREKLLHRISSDVLHQLFTLTSINLTQHAQAALLRILNSAADLQHTLILQKAQYEMHFFRNKAETGNLVFDQERMESVNDFDGNDDDGNVFVDRKFVFCVFPCLEKFGDEFGERTEIRNVLLKARVSCTVG